MEIEMPLANGLVGRTQTDREQRHRAWIMAKRKKKSAKTARMTSGRGYCVFMSHATADKWIAKALCEKIETTGASTFRDERDIKTGDDIPEEIRRKLAHSRELVLLLTPDSADRPWVLLEAGAFWGKRKNARIVAVLCHVEVDPIPDMIKSKKAISINDFDDYLKDLSTRVMRHKP